jgi:1-acyl-sn-glycerol-3-phosphate acyltransferase
MDYLLPVRKRISRFLIRSFFRNFMALIFKIQIEGLENIPAEGPYLIAHNHISVVEPPLVGSFWPTTPEAIAAAYLWDKGGLESLVVKGWGCIPVRRGQFDRQLIEDILQILRSGRPLLIAPEGKRSHTPGLIRAFPGIGYLVTKAQVPVVPVGVVGSTAEQLKRAFRFKRPVLEMRIGKVMNIEPVKGPAQARRESRQIIADQIMLQIAALLPADYQGLYAGRG